MSALMSGEVETALDNPPRRVSRRPCPLKIKAAEMAGDVDDFADEIMRGRL
jgi:hypothetical protein